MKKLFCFILTSLVILSCTTFHNGNNFSVTMELDSVMSNTPQKAYLYWTHQNEWYILDSALIANKQKSVRLEGKIPYQYKVFVAFEKEGPSEMTIVVTPGDRIKIKFDEKDIVRGKRYYVDTPEFGPNHEYYKCQQINSQLRSKRERLLELSCSDSLNASQKKSVEDSIEICDNAIRKNYEILVGSEYPYLADYSLILLTDYCNIDVFKDQLLKKFPDYIPLKELYKLLPCPKQSAKSKIIQKKMVAIIHDIVSKTALKSGPVAANKGNLLDVALHKSDGETESLGKYKGKYVLVDFWASWCVPCLKAMPKIIRAKEMFGSDLEICAITLDKSRIPWINAIGKNHLHGMNHYMGIDSNKRMFKDIETLGIKSIPQNYLLGRDGKIIAINLDGDELISKLKELIEVRHE